MAACRSAASWAIALLLVVGISVLAGAEAQSDSCTGKPFIKVPFMKTPVSQDDLGKLLTDVEGVFGLGGAAKPDMAVVKEDAITYLKKYSMQPIAGVVAMFALVILSLLVFLLWRFIRCLCVLCCQPEAYADGAKILTSRGFRARKGAMFILGLIGMAVAAWGMASVDKNFPAQISKEVDTIQEFPISIIDGVTNLTYQLGNLTVPIDQFSDIVANDINIPAMKADLDHIDDFFTNAPSPSDIQGLLTNLNTALGTLKASLTTLAHSIDTTTTGAPLEKVKDDLTKLTSFSLTAVNSSITDYNTKITALMGTTPTPVLTSNSVYQSLKTEQAIMGALPAANTGINLWLGQLTQCIDAANDLQSLQTVTPPDPFLAITSSLADVASKVAIVKDPNLKALNDAIVLFNNMWYNNASTAMQSLLDRANTIDTTVMELPSTITSQLSTLQSGKQDVDSLYANTLQGLPNIISGISSNITMPSTTSLSTQLTTASGDFMSVNFVTLVNGFTGLQQALQTFQTQVTNLGGAMSTYEGVTSPQPADWTTLNNQLTTTSNAASAVQTGNPGLNSYSDNGFSTSASGWLSMIEGSDMNSQSTAISSASNTIDGFSQASFSSSLTRASSAYPSNIATLTTTVSTNLDQVQISANTNLGSARSQVLSNKEKIDNVVANLKNFAVSKIDDYQSKYLLSDGSGGDTPMLQKYWALGYKALVGAPGLVMLFMVLVFIFTYINWPAGMCLFSFLLNILLILFALFPIFYTIFMVALRDTCANVEYIGLQAVKTQMGDTSMAYKLAHFYLADGTLPDGSQTNVAGLVGSINSNYDFDAIKSQVNDTINNALNQISSDYPPRPKVQAVLDDITARVNLLLTSLDGVVALLDYPEVHKVIMQIKDWMCCDLTNQLYVQWVSCLVLLAMTWLAKICALMVLKKLDALSESCCACSCYNARDYAAGGKHEATADGDADTVAVITTGKQSDKKYEVSDSQTPLPAALGVMASPPSAPRIESPRMYPTIGPIDNDGGASAGSGRSSPALGHHYPRI